MAAPRVPCAHCREPFDRRQVTQTYCAKDECRRARNARNFRDWWHARNALEKGRHQAAWRGRAPA